ncbi:pyridoxamine 5'-phosphate oxidase family protein [Halogeometricum borinquense]|uniref:Pyridoxamine 5'-phosphate oxidase family protein n=1 Tax=Halogeometricum borinquense TaxID=60847 RepID=A0A6C0UG69_9EURY|nr:pyridoxamine 5'-phosphate oxidase family protein [Halogeometricum borinquense]QIB74395.1 pyridoxamine 5'-phosphate oxidase family protein [Halogeometricum borinquense]
MDHIEFVYTLGMTDEEIEKRLQTETAGVLSLADEGRAYGVPVSHHYDGESLFFRLGDDDHSKKLEFVETTKEACFVLFGVDGDDSWSILVAGTLSELSGDERKEFDAATINDWFGSFRVFDEAIDEIELTLFEMEISSVTGRKTGE